MKRLLVLLLFPVLQNLSAQTLSACFARYSDSFIEWDIYVDTLEEATANLSMTWQHPNNWTEWNYRLDDHSGTIKTKWQKELSQWETKGDNKIVSAQMMWTGDPREWRITDNTFSIELKCKYGNNMNEWIVDDSKRGTFRVFAQYENDPRDWIIEDDLDPSVSLPMKMTLLFLVLFNSVPKH